MADQDLDTVLRPIVTGWLGKIEQAIKHKKPFNDIAEQCTAFFSASTGFMWDPKYRKKYLNTSTSPRFRMTMAKAFELVALFGPSLYWRNPKRKVKPRRQPPISPEVFGPPNMQELQQMEQQMQQQMQQIQQQMQQAQQQAQQMQQQMQQGQAAAAQGDPQAQQSLQQMQPQIQQAQQQMQQMQQQAQQLQQQMQQMQPQFQMIQQAQQIFEQSKIEQRFRKVIDTTRSEMVERWLNYTPDEQPGGGLARHAEMAITEALVKGRGVLWVAPYTQAGSELTMTGSFYDTVDNLFIDPDAETLEDAKWIAKREVKPAWELERDYGLKSGTLEGKANMESSESQGERLGDDMANLHRKQGKTFDLIVHWKIWSKGGVGVRLTGVKTDLKERFDEVVGDFAYICVAANVPWPLNAPPKKFQSASDEEVQKMFSWPVPYWRDGRWPCSVLDFYPKPRSSWPIAPLAPGLGELAFMNVVISHLANRIWSSSRDFIAVLKSAEEEVTKAIKKGEDLAVIPLNEVHQDIKQVVSFLQQPQTNFDVWRILEQVMQLFERRTGLTELMSGMTSTQSRSATDIATKKEQMSIRPDHMAGKVESWMTECAKMEKICTRWFVEPKDVKALFGDSGAMLWEKLITSQDPEAVVREIDATVEAGSVRKPNKVRDIENIQQALQVLFPVLDKHADTTTDTRQLNRLLQLWADTVDFDISGMELDQRLPMQFQPWFKQQQQEEMQGQQQAQQQQAEQQQQMEQAKLQVQQMQAQSKMQTEQMKMQSEQMKTQSSMAESQQKAQMDSMQVQQEMQQSMMEGQLDIQKSRIDLEKSLAESASEERKRQLEQVSQIQGMTQAEETHQRDLSRDGEKHSQEMNQDKEEFSQDMKFQRARQRLNGDRD